MHIYSHNGSPHFCNGMDVCLYPWIAIVFCRKKFEMQKLKIEQDFAEKAKLVQLELEREREKAKSEKEKYENEKAKLEHERKKLEQLKLEIREREERNANAVSVNKLTSNSDNSLNNDKSVNTNKSDIDLNNTSTNTHPLVSTTNLHSAASSVSITSQPVNASHGLVTNNMAATVWGVSSNEQVGLELHESIHSLEQTPALTDTELLEREKQLLLQREKLDAMQAQLNGKSSGIDKAQDSSTSEILQFVTEKEKLEQQRILLERAKFSAESKER